MPATTIPKRPARRQAGTDAEALAERLDGLPPLDRALEVVGDRWSLAVVAQLTAGPQRFNELAESVAPIARTVLSDRLRRLEAAGVLSRRQYQDSPPRWEYRLTIAGAELAKPAATLADWGSRHLGSGQPVLRHAVCGSEVTPAYRCLACGPVSPREIHTAMLRTPMPQG